MSIQFLGGLFVFLLREWFPSLQRLGLFSYLLIFHFLNQIIYRYLFGRISIWGICQLIPMQESVRHKVGYVLICISNGLWVALGCILVGVGVGFAINFKAYIA